MSYTVMPLPSVVRSHVKREGTWFIQRWEATAAGAGFRQKEASDMMREARVKVMKTTDQCSTVTWKLSDGSSSLQVCGVQH